MKMQTAAGGDVKHLEKCFCLPRARMVTRVSTVITVKCNGLRLIVSSLDGAVAFRLIAAPI